MPNLYLHNFRKVSICIFLLFTLIFGTVIKGKAQIVLASSPFTENFNSIGSGLPAGWSLFTGATATSVGTSATLTTTATSWATTTGQFANCSSANSPAASGDVAATQNARPDRALSIRQTGAFGNPGASFMAIIGNTTGKVNFGMSISHQMLSVQPKSTAWSVQYSTNGGSAWTTIGTYSDPAVFGSASVGYTFGSALDNLASNVYIRVVALAAATGAGNADTYGIDDFQLTWSLAASITPSPSSLSGLTYSFGAGPSAAASFTLTAGNLTAGGGIITITAPTDYEVSTTSATTGFGTTATLVYTGTGTISPNTVWVRLKAGLAIGNYNSETVAISGGSGSSSVTVSGTVTSSAFVSITSGDWNSGSTWSTGTVPVSTDNVVISSTHTVYTTSSLDRSGATTTVNGNFELRGGGYAFGNSFSYAATGSGLIFNNGSLYSVNTGEAFWPATNQPYNVTVNSGSGADLQIGIRMVAGTLSLAGQFNVGTAGYLVVAGTLQLNSGGYINSNSPSYATGSLLLYVSGAPYNRNLEWTSFSTAIGTPYNVQLSNGMTLNYPAGTISAQTVQNNLTIDAGASLYMDYSGVNSNGALTVGGNFNLTGNFSMGNTFGDDLKVGGDMNFSSGYGFFPNQRAVIFTKAGGTQTINSMGATAPAFHYLNITATGGGIVKLGTSTNLSITCPVAGNVITFSNAADVIDLNDNSLSLGTAAVTNTISGSGSLKGTASSNLTLLGSGTLGTLRFQSGFEILGNLTIDKTAGAEAAVLGTVLNINNKISFANGLLNLASNNLIIAAAATYSGAGSNSFVQADGSGQVIKKFTAASSFTFPVGDATGAADYSPATFTLNSGAFSSGFIGVSVKDAAHPNNTASPTSYITRYWNITNGGITGYNFDASFNYINSASDITGSEPAIRTGGYDGAYWYYENNANTTTHTLSVTGSSVLASSYSGANVFTPIGTKPSDYFRSAVASGSWNAPASWESSPTGGAPWITATLAPTSAANTITILATNQINVNSSITADQVVINGTLEIQGSGIINLNDVAGDDITINSGGIMRTLGLASYGTELLYGGSSNIHVLSGGKITVGTGGGIAGGGQAGYAFNTNNNLWDNNAVFEWNTTNSFTTSGIVYFPSASANIPIFRISAATSGGANTPNTTTWNGRMEVNANTSLINTADKIIRNGIAGTAILTAANANIKITGANAVLDGASLRINNSQVMYLSASVNVPTGAVVSFTGSSSIDNNTIPGALTVNGSLDIGTETITNTAGTITVNGTLKTAYTGTGGVTGTNGAIPSGTVTFNNTTSTIEYNAAAAQTITSRADYFNLTASGSGAKTISSGFNPAGTVYVTGSAALDAVNFSFGNTSTNLTMDGGRFRMSGTGTKPDIDGTYNLSGGVIEFYNALGTRQTVKGTNNASAPIVYNQIEITGSNAGQSNNTILLNATAGKFTVKTGGNFFMSDRSIKSNNNVNTSAVSVEAGGIFSTAASMGFSGFPTNITDNSSVHSNIAAANITLASTSTVDYYGTSAQVISNQVPYGNFTISSNTVTATKTAPTGTLSILGNITKSGTAPFAHNNGIVTLDGTTIQTYSAADSLDFYTLVNNNTTAGGFTVSGVLGIANLYTPAVNSYLTLSSGYMSMRSTASGTAAVDKMNTTTFNRISYGTGRFRIERYIKYPRRWQLLSIPTTDNVSRTVRSEWMEGSITANDNRALTYGMQVTDFSGSGGANGFDNFSYTPSVKYYQPATDDYAGISNPSSFNIARPTGYFTYVRGDRTSLSTNVAAVPTHLRTAGKIQGGANITVTDPTATGSRFQVIGNPYPSAVDLRLLTQSSLTNISGYPNIYVWDPSLPWGLNGIGKFIALTYNGTDYMSAVGSGLYANSGPADFIQSGQAFFVQSAGGSAGSVTFGENAKVTSSQTVSFAGPLPTTLRTNLFIVSTSGQEIAADGAVALFGDNMNSELDNDDVAKMLNQSDNLSLKTGGKLLSFERRHTITGDDTLHLNISAMQLLHYRFKINGSSLAAPGRSGWLIDRMSGNATALDLGGETPVDFSITNVAASYAADRFIIVFKQLPRARFISVNAAANYNKTIAVSWQVANENNVNSYSVERSGNCHDFAEINVLSFIQNGNNTASYNLPDAQRLKEADTYFRVKMMLASGEIVYSDIVKVGLISDAIYTTVSPNPVAGKTIHLQLSNQPAGDYSLQLINESGQSVYKSSITVRGYFETKNISLDKRTAAGIYSLIMVDESGKKNVIRVTVL